MTGHLGFKGDWLVRMLLAMNANVGGLGIPNRRWSHPPILTRDPRLSSIIGDVTDHLAVEECIQNFQPEVVFHLAAEAIVSTAAIEPRKTFCTNVMGTLNILDSCERSQNVGVVVVITSDKVYGDSSKRRVFSERHPIGGREAYGLSKACAEFVTLAYRQRANSSGRRGVVSARAGNIIGGNDWSVDRLVPDLARAFLFGTPLEIRRPTAIRPWQHVLDALHGYLMLAENAYMREISDRDGSWNFGPDPSAQVTVRDLVRLFEQEVSPRKSIAWSQSNQNFYESDFLAINSSKSHSKLGWWPKLSINETVKWTANWYMMSHTDSGVDSLTSELIERYLMQKAMITIKK